jgi:glycosyltransferase involved in cell wall biosynthesis
MPQPLVSIVVLNYNYARFLPRSVESALGQDWQDVEVIVVDDCSTDASRRVIQEFGDRIRPVLQARNRGHGAAMNAGFAASKGETVMFLDADDYLYPTAARRIAAAWGADMAQYQFRLDLVDAEERVLDAFPPRELGWEDGDVRPNLLSRGRFVTTVTSGLAFDRRVLEAVLPMDEEAFRQGGDGYLVTVAPLYGPVKTIDEPLGAYRQHGANHSQFAADVAGCARWRIRHDQMRYRALQEHARRLKLECGRNVWRNDAMHLQDRIASVLLAPEKHPHPLDDRHDLARAGFRACAALPVPDRRRRALQVWWRLVGEAPLPLARAAAAWRLQAATRPPLIRWAARAIRRATSIGPAAPRAVSPVEI